MAKYEHLPIYKQTYDLLVASMAATKHFPREYKYTLGQNIKTEIVELVVFIYRANSAQDKTAHIRTILERIQVIQVLIRVCHDMRIMERRHYARLAGMTDNLGRQAQGWLKKMAAPAEAAEACTNLHDPRGGAVYKSSPEMFRQVPPHKSLRRGNGRMGLPIGNLTSQFFANVYLNELDQFVKRRLKAKQYGRYVDDMVILHECPRTLLAWQAEIDRFLQERLKLRLHPRKTQMNLLDRGLNFIGFIIKPGRCYLRRSTVAGCKHRIWQWERRGRPVDATSLAALCQSVNSYLGMLRQVDGYRTRQAICGRVATLFLRADEGCTKIGPV